MPKGIFRRLRILQTPTNKSTSLYGLFLFYLFFVY